MQKNQQKAYLYALLAILFWSTAASAFKVSLLYQDLVSLLLFASLTSLLVLGVVIVVTGKVKALRRLSYSQAAVSMLLGLFNPFLYYLVLFKAYDLLPAQEAMTLNYAWPLVLALLSAPILKHPLGLKSVIALIISFSGIVVIATNGKITALEFQNLTGTSLALASSVIWALFWLLNAKSRLHESLKLFLNFFWGSIYILLLIIITGNFPKPCLYAILSASYVGAFEMGITFILWLKALQLTKRTDKISQLVFLAPFLSLVFINIIVGETIQGYTITGLLLIVAGIILQQYDGKRSN